VRPRVAGEGTVNMGQAAVNAATNTHAQLVTYLADAQTMLNFAQANTMNLLSIWAIQRDNGGCPGTRDSNTCSGITQNTRDFSHLLQPFTG